MVTWVASQKFESSTARTLSRLSSPERPRLWATMSETKPVRPVAAAPMPFFQTRSSMIPRATAPQATKMPEE